MISLHFSDDEFGSSFSFFSISMNDLSDELPPNNFVPDFCLFKASDLMIDELSIKDLNLVLELDSFFLLVCFCFGFLIIGIKFEFCEIGILIFSSRLGTISWYILCFFCIDSFSRSFSSIKSWKLDFFCFFEFSFFVGIFEILVLWFNFRFSFSINCFLLW